MMSIGQCIWRSITNVAGGCIDIDFPNHLIEDFHHEDEALNSYV